MGANCSEPFRPAVMHLISRRAPCVKRRRRSTPTRSAVDTRNGGTLRGPGPWPSCGPAVTRPAARSPASRAARPGLGPQALPFGNGPAASGCVSATWYNLCRLAALDQPAGLDGHEACCRNATINSRAPKRRGSDFLVTREHGVCYGPYPIGAPVFRSDGTAFASWSKRCDERQGNRRGCRDDSAACKVTGVASPNLPPSHRRFWPERSSLWANVTVCG